MLSHELLKGTLQPLVLRMLDQHGQLYGYEITQRVKLLTEGQVTLTEGSLYPALHKLEAEALVTSEVRSIGQRKRRYYRLTDAGRLSTQVRVNEIRRTLMLLQDLFSSEQPFASLPS